MYIGFRIHGIDQDVVIGAKAIRKRKRTKRQQHGFIWSLFHPLYW